MRGSRLPLSLALTLAFVLTACGSDETPEPTPQPPPASAGIAAGPGISIDEAIAFGSAEPVLVNGWLRAEGEEIRLCDAMAESYPPQCVGTSLLVEGLKLEEVDGLTRAGDVAWTEQTQLLGIVADGKIKVSENAMA
jgi:hypothetical protein